MHDYISCKTAGNSLLMQCDTSQVGCGNETTILVVDDDEMILDIIQEVMNDHGYAVLTAANAEQAIRVARINKEIDLLISDVVMPGLSGYEHYEQLLMEIPALKVIFMSGYSANFISLDGSLDKNISSLQKPFVLEELMGKAQRLLNCQY